MLHTDDILSYQYTQDNEKDVYLRWIHLEED
nr:MAG TPA: GatB/GatE catalytic domain protein [Caudoviricetes sp.]